VSADQRVVVGRFGAVHGVRGWVKIFSSTEPVDNLFSYKPLYIEGTETKVEIDQWQRQGKGIVCHVIGFDDRDEAKALTGKELAVPISLLPELDDGEFYWHQLTGVRVISLWEGQSVDFGLCTEVMATGANDVLVVVASDGKERLIPWLPDDIVTRVDLDAREIEVQWDPEF
jgi:16S rRNA processing protein RimM